MAVHVFKKDFIFSSAGGGQYDRPLELDDLPEPKVSQIHLSETGYRKNRYRKISETIWDVIPVQFAQFR